MVRVTRDAIRYVGAFSGAVIHLLYRRILRFTLFTQIAIHGSSRHCAPALQLTCLNQHLSGKLHLAYFSGFGLSHVVTQSIAHLQSVAVDTMSFGSYYASGSLRSLAVND